ncbi:S-adenosyl-L-methionine-dependent methyltransferase [Mycena maculata]|uniref:S-adenosyl-L-methionine-dependent methyltransferase n=1 Tax=Mycena maculata TaxID=230809 RepID=A0AAD7K5T3_9AGAR|nr:S-adenosyl-L-methionine-dependent methyltransferase [Mycena maculata]
MSHSYHHDFTSANEAVFDKHAADADHRPMAAELAEIVSAAILQAHPFDREATAVLDYACGIGIVSRRLAPHCKTLLGVDISQGMVVRAELKGEATELGGTKFDVVVCSPAYHHLADIAAATRVLASFLKPGGALLVVDFPAMDVDAIHVPEDIAHTITHKGGLRGCDQGGV